MKVSLTGVSLHVRNIEASKAFYLKVPGAVVEHERPGFFASIRIGTGRVNLVQLARSEKFHLEMGTDELDTLRQHLEQAGIREQGPQPSQWGERGWIVCDPDGNFVEFDDHID